MEKNENAEEEKNAELREAFGVESISIDDEDSLPYEFDDFKSPYESGPDDADGVYEMLEENFDENQEQTDENQDDEKTANENSDEVNRVEILEGENLFQNDPYDGNEEDRSKEPEKLENSSPDFTVVNQKIQNLESKTDSLLESVSELVQGNSQLLSDISTTIKNKMISVAPEVISGLEDSVKSTSSNMAAALKNSLQTLPELDEWAKKTSSNFKSVNETLLTSFSSVSDSLERFRNIEKKELKIKNFKWLVFGVSLFFCLAAGAFIGWKSASSFISYESLITSHFDSRVEKIVNEKWSAVEKQAETKAENIIQNANRQAKAILQKANEQAAEIQSSAIVSVEKAKSE